ncbi:hypothetical protein [Catellatospora sp. NPDC049609]|uniref:hypothetical protein n=1 Tax=Catellatospora sp. NPDC049609 TaxID=3155505 RepID=UPI0034362A1B
MTAPTKRPPREQGQTTDTATQAPDAATQPPRAAGRAPVVTPVDPDIEEAAARFAAKARTDVADLEPLDRYVHLDWWRAVYARAAQLVETEVMGAALAELSDQGRTLREIETLLAAQGTPLSDTMIGRRITAARAANARDAAAARARSAASSDDAERR